MLCAVRCALCALELADVISRRRQVESLWQSLGPLVESLVELEGSMLSYQLAAVSPPIKAFQHEQVGSQVDNNSDPP